MMLAVVKYYFKTNDTRTLSQISFGPLIEEKINSIFKDQNGVFFEQFTKQLEKETQSMGLLIHNQFAEVRESEYKSFLKDLKSENFALFENEARRQLSRIHLKAIS